MLDSRLRGLREQSGNQQKDVAESLGISKQVYSNYELGKREPDYGMVVRIAEYFNVSTDYLLGKPDNPAPYSKTKKEPTLRERVTQEINSLLDRVPDEKLDKVKALLQATIDVAN